jgi:hypothetical protein
MNVKFWQGRTGIIRVLKGVRILSLMKSRSVSAGVPEDFIMAGKEEPFANTNLNINM